MKCNFIVDKKKVLFLTIIFAVLLGVGVYSVYPKYGRYGKWGLSIERITSIGRAFNRYCKEYNRIPPRLEDLLQYLESSQYNPTPKDVLISPRFSTQFRYTLMGKNVQLSDIKEDALIVYEDPGEDAEDNEPLWVLRFNFEPDAPHRISRDVLQYAELRKILGEEYK